MEGAQQLLANIYANSVVTLEDPGSSVAMTEKSVVRKIALADSAGDDDDDIDIVPVARSVALSEDRNRMENEYQAIQQQHDAFSEDESKCRMKREYKEQVCAGRGSKLSGKELKILTLCSIRKWYCHVIDIQDDMSIEIQQLFNNKADVMFEERDDQEEEKSKTNKTDEGLRSNSSFISQCGQEMLYENGSIIYS